MLYNIYENINEKKKKTVISYTDTEKRLAKVNGKLLQRTKLGFGFLVKENFSIPVLTDFNNDDIVTTYIIMI